jgi:hypothetical protein
MHAQRAALIIVGHGLDHAAENVGVDLLPVQIADLDQVRPGNAAEAGTSVLPEKSCPLT